MTYDKCPKCGDEVWMVEYSITSPAHYDGVSEYACKGAKIGEERCDWRIGRFCGKELQPYEYEPPYCTGEKHILVA